MNWWILHWKSASKSCSVFIPYFSCLGLGSLGGEWWFPSMLAPHSKRMEVLCATLGVGCGDGVPLDISSEHFPGVCSTSPWAQEMSQSCDLGRLRRDVLVAQICCNCVCHLDCSVLKLLSQVSLVRGVNREIFCVVTYWFLNPLNFSEQSSRCSWTHQFAQRFSMSYKYLRLYVVLWVWLKFSIHFRNLN